MNTGILLGADGTDQSEPFEEADLSTFTDIMAFTHSERPVGDYVAAITETETEARIDIANGLRHHGGRRPVPADFDDLFTVTLDENDNDVVGTEIPGPVLA